VKLLTIDRRRSQVAHMYTYVRNICTHMYVCMYVTFVLKNSIITDYFTLVLIGNLNCPLKYV
jgi:hypothetical protein